jgi:hypothetical protein
LRHSSSEVTALHADTLDDPKCSPFMEMPPISELLFKIALECLQKNAHLGPQCHRPQFELKGLHYLLLQDYEIFVGHLESNKFRCLQRG